MHLAIELILLMLCAGIAFTTSCESSELLIIVVVIIIATPTNTTVEESSVGEEWSVGEVEESSVSTNS